MEKYRKKPVVIEAIQFTGNNRKEVAEFVGKSFMEWTNHPEVGIATCEGDMRAKPNDWIIKGVKGEFYPCKPDIFEQTYEKVYIDEPDCQIDKGCPLTLECDRKNVFEQLKASHDKLVTALQRYGDHKSDCNIWDNDVCNCGFSQALKEAEKLK